MVITYLIWMLQWPEFSVCLPEIGNVNINASFFRRFDYSNAMVSFIIFKLWNLFPAR